MDNFPDTYLVGVQKAGTTAFYDWLAQHPDIFAPSQVKDYHFFLHDAEYQKGLPHLSNLYRDHDSQARILHGGVNYIFSEKALIRIKETSPNARFLLVLRDPVLRAFSAYRYFSQLGIEDRSFDQALQDEKNGVTDKQLENHLTYIQHGLYFEQISLFKKHFSFDQLKVLIFEKIKENFQQEMSGVFSFLDVDSQFIPVFSVKNKTGKVRFRSLNKLVYRDSPIKRLSKKIIPQKIRYKFSELLIANNIYSAPPQKISTAQYVELQQLFAADIQQLQVLLNENLNEYWKNRP